MKKIFYISAIFALALSMDSCTKEVISPVDEDNYLFMEDNSSNNRSFSRDNFSRDTFPVKGGGNIVDPDNDDDNVEKNFDNIVDPDNKDQDLERDNE